MEKNKEFMKKHREMILYLIFGVLTTFVGWAVYFSVLFIWRSAFALPVEDTTSSLYFAGYTTAQILHWIAAVLFAFFTNRAWVFTDADKNVNIWAQLGKFSLGRVATFVIDFLVTWLVALGLATLLPTLSSVAFIGREWNFAEIGAKVLAAVIVIIVNYIFSKIFVFKKK